MKQQWVIRRRAVTHQDGQHRWDQLYQHLLRWADPSPQESHRQEVSNESGHLCPLCGVRRYVKLR